MDDSLSALQLSDFTAQLASKAPVPGGGGVAALVGALAAALGTMAANLTLGKKKYLPYEAEHRSIIAETDALRLRLLELIDEDAAVFEPLSRAYAMDRNDPEYAPTLLAATVDACRVPLETMRYCADLISLLERLRGICSALLLSDVGCAALAARAAMESAAMNVFVNTRSIPEAPEAVILEAHADKLLREYIPRAQAVADLVTEHLRTPR
ncbi:MAG: cyclodeaminase/cyclohydrolase family protein [Oscillospiraceae bacterium]|nr:cyclodeaminase/cyclohydrolase family protein [Oscillospiraceae bacterium]